MHFGSDLTQEKPSCTADIVLKFSHFSNMSYTNRGVIVPEHQELLWGFRNHGQEEPIHCPLGWVQWILRFIFTA